MLFGVQYDAKIVNFDGFVELLAGYVSVHKYGQPWCVRAHYKQIKCHIDFFTPTEASGLFRLAFIMIYAAFILLEHYS